MDRMIQTYPNQGELRDVMQYQWLEQRPAEAVKTTQHKANPASRAGHHNAVARRAPFLPNGNKWGE